MMKAANVQILKRIDIGGGLVTVIVSGDVGSVRSAVEVGANVAERAEEPMHNRRSTECVMTTQHAVAVRVQIGPGAVDPTRPLVLPALQG